MAALVRAHAVDNTVVVTFGNERQKHFTLNWVHHLQQIGVGGLLVGMMNSKPAAPKYVQIAAGRCARTASACTRSTRPR